MNEELVIGLKTDAKSKKGIRHTDCSIIIQFKQHEQDGYSLLAVKDIAHNYIVVENICDILCENNW